MNPLKTDKLLAMVKNNNKDINPLSNQNSDNYVFQSIIQKY